MPSLSTDNRQAVDARTRLTLEEIADAALRIVDEEGLDALTMRRLSRALGVGTMTLYGYVRDKGELLDAVIDAAIGHEPVNRVGGTWQDQVRALARQYHALLARHPALISLRLQRPIVTPGALRVTEAALEALLGAGLAPAEAARAFRVLFLYVFGTAAFNQPRQSAAASAATRAAIGALPGGEYPRLTATASEVAATIAGSEQFEYGLELVIEAIEARVAAAGGG